MRMSLGRGPACGDESSGLLCWPQHLEDVLCCRVWQAWCPSCAEQTCSASGPEARVTDAQAVYILACLQSSYSPVAE